MSLDYQIDILKTSRPAAGHDNGPADGQQRYDSRKLPVRVGIDTRHADSGVRFSEAYRST